MKSRVVTQPRGLVAQWKLIQRMLGFLAPVKFHVVVTCVVFIAFSAVESYLIPSLLKSPVDIVEKLSENKQTASVGVMDWLWMANGPGADLRNALLILAAARIFFSLLIWAKNVTGNWQSMSMVFYMRSAVYDRLQRVGFSFHDLHSTGTLINRALSDLQSVRNFVVTGLQSSVEITFSLFFAFILLYRECSPTVALAALIPLPFWFLAVRRMALLSQPIYERQVKASDEMIQLLTENLAGVHVVRAFATEKQEHDKFKAANENLLLRLLEAVKLRVRLGPLIRGIAAASHIGLFAIGAVLVQDKGMSKGALVILGMAMGTILGKIMQINTISDAYQQAVVSSGRLFEILDSADTTPQHVRSEPLRPGGGGVRFSHVSFAYEPGQNILEDVSFTAPAGSVIALVGPTGSGKTTLANLLGRFYDPDLGKIEIDGQDLRDVTVQSVRDSVGYVFQETYLFNDTIARNIAYGDLTAPREKIIEAARIARGDEFIERLPKKYDNMIGEYGASLSGGQRQRLAIARAVLHNPRIMVMDDALAAVDPETEAQIRAGLERIMAGRTVFLIASRISTARRANKILVLENGRITQSGTHDELMAQPGYYRDVASSQFSTGITGHKQSHMDRMARLTKSGRVFNEP